MIPPTIKSKHRYIVFRIMAKPVFTPNQIIQAIRQSVLSFIGELGYADAEFEVVEYVHDAMIGIVRTTPGHVDDVITAMGLITNIQGKNAGVIVLGVSGTVNKAKQKFGMGKKNLFKGDETQ